MLWLCQITFAGVGALATGQFATEHGWPVLLAMVGGGAIAALLGLLIGLLHHPARQPLRRAGDPDVRSAHGAPRVQPGGLLAVRRRRRGRPPGLRVHRQGVHLPRARDLRGDRHPHREPAPVDHRPRAERGPVERERVAHDGPQRDPDEDAGVGSRRVRRRRRRRSLRGGAQAGRSRSTTSPSPVWSGWPCSSPSGCGPTSPRCWGAFSS